MIEFNENLQENIVNQPNHYADTRYECRPVACEIFKDLKGTEAIDERVTAHS